MTRPIEAVLAALDTRGCLVRQVPGGFSCQCPVHEDRTPSLSIREERDGRVLLHCHAGCSPADIIAALGLRMRDLFPESGRAPGRPHKRYTEDQFRDCTTYIYRDATDQPVLLVTRRDLGTGEKQFAQYRSGGDGSWLKGLEPTTPRPLYGGKNLHEAIHAGRTVFVVEGEKCVEALTGVGLVATTNPGGAGKHRPEHVETLRHAASVVFVPDNDKPGRDHVEAFASDLARARCADVRVLELPGLGPKEDVYDWLARHPGPDNAAADLMRIAEAAPQWFAESEEPAHRPDSRPEIRYTTDIHDVHNAALDALAARAPGLFEFSHALVRIIAAGEKYGPSQMREPENPIISAVEPETLQESLSEVARFTERDERGNVRGIRPPISAARALRHRGEYPGIRKLVGLAEAPIIRPDGTIFGGPGYDAETGIFVAPRAEFPPVPEGPTREDAAAALALLADPLAEFPFANQSDLSAAVSAIITLACRYAIRGNVPMYTGSAPTAGTGKTLLIDVIVLMATGRLPLPVSGSGSDEEIAKMLLSVALEGWRAFSFDNVEYPLGWPSLSKTLTSGICAGRRLGLNRMAAAPWVAVAFATGNNISYRGDTARRVVPIRIDSRKERPEDRDFRVRDLRAHVRERWPDYFVAALTVFRAFHVAGRPGHGLPRMGSFEEWDDTVRAALLWLGMADPLAGRETVRAEADSDLDTLRTFVSAWHGVFGDAPTGVATAIQTARSADSAGLQAALAALDFRGDGTKINPRIVGAFLRKYQRRPIGGLWIVPVRTEHGSKLWSVEPTEPAPGGDDHVS